MNKFEQKIKELEKEADHCVGCGVLLLTGTKKEYNIIYKNNTLEAFCPPCVKGSVKNDDGGVFLPKLFPQFSHSL